MTPQSSRRVAPCDQCRDKHLKCDSQTPCTNCKKSSSRCIRSGRRIRFKHLITTQKKLTWIQVGSPKAKTGSKLTDESDTDDTSEPTSSAATDQAPEDSTQRTINGIPQVSRIGECKQENQHFQSPPFATVGTQSSVSDNSYVDHNTTIEGTQNPSQLASTSGSTQQSNYTYNILPVLDYSRPYGSSDPGSTKADGSNHSGYDTDQVRYSQTSLSPATNFQSLANERAPGLQTKPLQLSIQEACLLRFFTQELAMVFDTSDKNHSYFTLLPLRALHSSLLLNAICTASARCLTQLWGRKSTKAIIEYNGVALPNLTTESAIYYHNNCISYLMGISADKKSLCSDDSIAAITILRYHEQVDTHFTGIDNETYTSVVKTMFKTSQDEEHGMLSIIKQPPPDSNVYASSLSSLRHSACLIALRQEIWSVLIHHRPFQLPLATDYDYTSLDTAVAVDDYDWTNIVIVWSAHVLQFCFRNEEDSQDAQNQRTRDERFENLKQFQRRWDESPPPYFAPIFFEGRNPAEGRYFPTIWVANRCQVLALQHMELARIVLSLNEVEMRPGEYNGGANLEDILRNATRRICGLAMSNQDYQESMVGAAVGLSICGKYFPDPGEQAAIAKLLITLGEKHVWPTSTLYNTLQESWAS